MTDFPGVVPALNQALNERGYETLTPVQNDVLAEGLETADMLVSAQTGSGKTVAFGLAIAKQLLQGEERLTRAGAPLALVIAPTRELALQVKRELEWLYKPAGAFIASCVGGMDMREERRNLERGAHIVVGTPGRLRDHITRKSLKTHELKAVILDEADEMLDLGFREELEFILETTPETRRTLMFSATVPRTIANLAKRYQRDAVRLSTSAEEKQHIDIEYRALMCGPRDQENAIINVLRYYEAKNAIIFCGTRATVNHMTSRFTNRGFQVVALSGELSQNERTHALQAMRDGRARVCVATDVAARGIDLPNLELVIHADIPKTAETLKHRSGRTGRAGRKGVCTIIVPNAARKRTERLLHTAGISAEWAKPPTADEVIERDHFRMLEEISEEQKTTASEKRLISQLLEAHSPEHIAGALIKRFAQERSAPEELSDVPSFQASPQREPRGKGRDDFTGGIWFSLSVGRKHQAEPRWIIPMICGAADFSKAQIGAINIQQEETYLEIDPGYVDKFLAGLGPNGMLEKTIQVTQVDGPPAGKTRGGDRDYGKPSYKDRKRGKRSDGPKRSGRDDRDPSQSQSGERPPRIDGKWGDKAPKKEYAERPGGERTSKPSGKSSGKFDKKPRGNWENDKRGPKPGSKNDPFSGAYADKPPRTEGGSEKPGSSKPKKPHKKKLARAAAKEAGLTGLKRKKTQKAEKLDKNQSL